MQGEGGGPKSARGKRVASSNAVKHGVRSDQPTIPGESIEEWKRHLRGVMEYIQPEGYLEEYFAGPLATLLWRHQRVVLFEVGTITANLEGAAKDARIARAYAQGTLSKGILPDLSSEQMERQAWRHLLPSDEDIDRIMRYGGSIHRQILQIFHEIEAMQARRKGERTPLARLDITGPPGA